MKNRFVAVFLMCAACLCVNAAYTGSVFVDENRNGIFDRGEKTLSGVMVSDGLNVVKTGSDGSFCLPGYGKERFIFITTPSGYKADNAYYIRIKADRQSYDFAVIPYEAHIGKDGRHRFVHISDTEIHGSVSNTEHLNWVQDIRDYAVNEEVSFIVHGGDICYKSGLKKHIRLMNSTNMEVPVYYSLGNHDLVKSDYGEELYEQIYGPVYYSFDVGSVHYVVTPMMSGDYLPSYKPSDVYRWLKNDLEQIPSGKPVIMFGHDLPVLGDSFVFDLGNGKQLDLDAYNLKVWLYGHWHINHVYRHKNAYSICTSTPVCGGIDHSAAAFRVMDIDSKGNFSSELRYPYIDKLLQIASVDNWKAPCDSSGKVQLIVNAYSTVSPVENIHYECRTEGENVFLKGTLQRQTDFTWSAGIPIPVGLSGKLIVVRATAEFGNGEVARSERSFFYRPSVSIVHLKQKWTNVNGNQQYVGARKEEGLDSLHLAWVQNVGSNIYMSSPVFYKGNVYVASVDENGKGKAAVTCMDASSGKIRWKYKVRNSIKNTIVAFDGMIVAQDVEGYCYSLNAVSGKLMWKNKLSVSPVLPALVEGLVVGNGVVYAGSGKGLCAMEVKNGKVLWRNREWSQNQGSTATFSLGNGVLVGSSHWDALYGNDAETGKLLWKAAENGIRQRSSSPVVKGDVFYLASDQSLFLMEMKTGRVLMRKKMPFSVNVASSPLITDDTIILGTAAEGLVALDRETWMEKWRYRTGKSIICTAPYFRYSSATVEASPMLIGNKVVVGGTDGVLYVLDKNNGCLLWKRTLGAPILATAAVFGNRLFVADYGGNVYAFDF